MNPGNCHALLLAILQRAVHDWVLYRWSGKAQRKYAHEAHVWLFCEGPGHPDWELRERSGAQLTSFLSICEHLDLDPEQLRARVLRMTVADITGKGRPVSSSQRTGIEDYKSPDGLDAVMAEMGGSPLDIHGSFF